MLILKKVCFFGVLLFSTTLPAQGDKGKLIWSDEFDRNGLPDSSKWTWDTRGNASGWGNNEAQFYTRNEPANARVENGRLIITAQKEKRESKSYTSARLITRGKASFTYGRMEIRAKLPAGKGTWPAIWMLGENISEKGWPACGEIDIMEHVGYEKDSVYGTVHTEAYNHVKGTQKTRGIFVDSLYKDFHVYSIDWTSEKIDFFVDGVLYNHFKNEHRTDKEWPFDKPFFFILNLAVGGNWGGKYGIDDSIFPVSMEVDYVRVYEN